MEQLQIIRIALVSERSHRRIVKLGIICLVDAVLQLFLREVGQQKAHDLVCCLLVGLLRKSPEIAIPHRQLFRNKQSPVRRKPLKDRLG